MIAVGLLGLGWYLNRLASADEPALMTDDEIAGRLPSRALTQMRLPPLLHDDVQEKSFAANQTHNSVRTPWGPNPHTHEVNSSQFIDWPQYRRRAQETFHTLRVLNQDWRLDMPFTSSMVNMDCGWHEQEPFEFLLHNAQNSKTPAPEFDHAR